MKKATITLVSRATQRLDPTTVWTGLGVAMIVLVLVAFETQPSHHPIRRLSRTAYNHAATIIGMATVATTKSNISYCGTSSRQQKLDLYLPKRGPTPYPLVVFIHGGGWSFGSKSDPIVSTYGPSIVRSGIAFASINYRLAPHYTYPIQSEDTACALSYLYRNASAYKLNNAKFALFGASAGGQLAGYAALSTADAAQPWRTAIRGVVDFYGVSDLADIAPRSHLGRVVRGYVGAGGVGAAVAASPVTYAGYSAPPFLIFHGNRDTRVPLAQSQELARDLTQHGNQAELTIVNHGGHGFGPGDQPSVGQIRNQINGFLGNVFNSAT